MSDRQDGAGRELVRATVAIHVYAWRLAEVTERIERKLCSSNSTEDANPLVIDNVAIEWAAR